MKDVNILNILVNNVTINELLNNLEEGFIVTPNIDHIMKLQNDKDFFDIYTKADYRLCDSKLLQIVSKFLNQPIIEKISGSDFFPAFYTFHKKNENIKIFLLGSASQEIVKKAVSNINNSVGRQIITQGLSPSIGFETNEEENKKIIEIINNSKATVLAVGVGAPKQEKWIMKYKNELSNIKIFMAIGATIDFEAGNIKRAPIWMSSNGLEWLYRLLSEPRRLWKRYLIADIPFFWLVLKQKLNLYKNPWENK